MSADHSRTSLPMTRAAASNSNQPDRSGPEIPGRPGPGRPGPERPSRPAPGQKRPGPKPAPAPAAKKPGEDPRHRAIALHHAHRIQAQKDTEALILDRILLLASSFPSAATTDPACPAASDSHIFKSSLTPFQPADYDNLIQERNIEGLCGYGLCPHEHRTDSHGEGGGDTGAGTFRIRYGAPGSGPGGRGREMNIVPKEKLEMWCSDACAERALYIRVQLAQEPVWERRGEDTRELVLLEEDRSSSTSTTTTTTSSSGTGTGTGSSVVGQVTERLGELNMHGTDTRAESVTRAEALALERGDNNLGRVDVHVRESQTAAVPPRLRPQDAQGGSIEGWVPSPRPQSE